MKAIEKDFKNKLTKKDYFLYLLNRNIFLLLSPIIIVTLIVVFVFMVAKDGFSSGDVLYLLPILLFLLSYVQVNNAIKNAIKSNESTESLKIILDDKKYKEITSNGSNELEYKNFYSYYESKNYFYLYVDKVNALILPKREFNNDELSIIDETLNKQIKKVSTFNIKNILGIVFSLSLVICMITLIISMF